MATRALLSYSFGIQRVSLSEKNMSKFMAPRNESMRMRLTVKVFWAQVQPTAQHARNFLRCKSIWACTLIGDTAGANTYPYIHVGLARRFWLHTADPACKCVDARCIMTCIWEATQSKMCVLMRCFTMCCLLLSHCSWGLSRASLEVCELIPVNCFCTGEGPKSKGRA